MQNISQSSSTSQRNYGIDLLRMLAMFMVIILHLFFQGGVIVSYGAKTASFEAAWFLEIAALCAVNCYALISGYVGLYSKYRYTNMLTLWFRVIYYTLAITAIFALYFPETVGITEWRNALFPVTTKQYWYLTAYFCLFLFIPLLNRAVLTLNQKQLRAILFGLLFAFTVLPTIYMQDVFWTSKGYSALWLIILYFLGAYIRKYNSLQNITIPKALLGYLGMIVLTWGTRLVIEFSTIHFLGEQKWENILVEYTSPTILAAAIFLFALFEKIHPGHFFQKLIAFFSPSAFSVYLIHTQPLIWTYILSGRFSNYAKLSLIGMIAAVLGTAFAIYVVCSLIDLLQRLLFHILKIDKRIRKIEEKRIGNLWSPYSSSGSSDVSSK